ncbi:hypothetical protein [Alcaligenes sp. Marseille-Q7550]
MNGDTPNPTPTLGPTGWALNYDLQVRSQGAALHLPDGRRLTLSPPARPEAGGWRWQGADGLMLHFNEQGWLTRLRTSARRWLHIERLPADRPDAHAVRQVRNHLGQVLRLDWQADRQALAVQTPAGLFRWRMTGQGGRPWLASVSRPDGLMRSLPRRSRALEPAAGRRQPASPRAARAPTAAMGLRRTRQGAAHRLARPGPGMDRKP